MKGTLSNFFLFATGALVGSVVTWKIVKTKYEQIAQEEIDSVKAVFARRMGAMEEDLDNKQAEIDDYTAIIEGIITKTCNSVRNYHTVEICATAECICAHRFGKVA